jgi:valyl-tRNA synthetase
MHPSVHRSPWPSLDELAAVPEPSSARTWPLTLQVVEAVRKAKADANLSIKAPVRRVAVQCSVEDGQALNHAVLDVTRMLSIQEFDLDDKPGKDGFVVTVQLGSG